MKLVGLKVLKSLILLHRLVLERCFFEGVGAARPGLEIRAEGTQFVAFSHAFNHFVLDSLGALLAGLLATLLAKRIVDCRNFRRQRIVKAQ